MQSYRKANHRQYWALAWLALAASWPSPAANAQGISKGLTARIEGSVLIAGETQPAARVRVDVRALSGSGLATTFTDASGRFAANAEGSVIVSVQEQGYEPVEQRVDLGPGGNGPGVVLTLRKLRAPLVPAGYRVSVRDLKIPAKARRAFGKGMQRLQKKDYQGSLDRFKEAINAFPDYYEAYYQIGVADLELRRGSDAEQALQRAIDLSGGAYARPQYALGAMLCDRQDYSDAERVLRRAIEVDSSSWEGHLLLGQALFGQQRLAESEKSANEALLRRPDVPATYILLANVHMARKEYMLAIQNLDTFLAMRPQGPISEQARSVREAAKRVASRLEQTVTLPRFLY
ncbi:MAG TPA: tetratricopeptide repeat protein [Candidatus Acidoferrum sp.]|nr:tetratricopeptide repeat protein [Candidatus Acidoferrum sp.]